MNNLNLVFIGNPALRERAAPVLKINDEDYISLTDMIKAKDGDFFVADWLRNRNTLEYIGIWERVNNPTFNYGEFEVIKSQAGLNSFRVGQR